VAFLWQVIAQMKRTCMRLNLLRLGTEASSRGTLATSVHHREEDSEFHPLQGGVGNGGANGTFLHRNGSGHNRLMVTTPNGGAWSSSTSSSQRLGAGGGNGAGGGGGGGGGVGGKETYSYIPMRPMHSDINSNGGDGVHSAVNANNV
jgi:hypothetical protein